MTTIIINITNVKIWKKEREKKTAKYAKYLYNFKKTYTWNILLILMMRHTLPHPVCVLVLATVWVGANKENENKIMLVF